MEECQGKREVEKCSIERDEQSDSRKVSDEGSRGDTDDGRWHKRDEER